MRRNTIRKPFAFWPLPFGALFFLVMIFPALLVGSCQKEKLPASLKELRRNLPVRAGLNVIVISFDALRPDVLGAYGSPRGLSPNIDAWAQKSLVFTRAYTVAPVTPTSFAAVFSGMLPPRVFHAWQFVTVETLAAQFQRIGYQTVGFANSVQLTPERGFDRGFELYRWQRGGDDGEFLEKVRKWFVARKSDQPLFAWIHLLLPHAPYPYREMAAHLYDPAYRGPLEKTTGERFTATDPQDIARIKSLYEGQVFYLDHLFGQFLASLQKLDLLHNSLIVLTADHGEEFDEHGHFQHGFLYEEHVRIPLIIFHPDAKSGSRTNVLYSNVDLYPTLLEIVGQPTSHAIDGKSLISIEREPRMLVGVAMTAPVERFLSFREGTSKLILQCRPAEKAELYDLAQDPGEKQDRIAVDKKMASGLRSQLQQILFGEPCTVMEDAFRGASSTTGLDAASVAALKALGYL